MQVTCYIPGLLLPGLVDRARISEVSLPHLHELLAKAQAYTHTPVAYAEKLFALFGLPHTQQVLPLAALTGLAHGLATTHDYWLRADPVHLQADLNTVYLFGNAQLALQPDELALLASELQPLLQAEEQLLMPQADAWYIRCTGDPDCRSQALYALLGRPLADELPQGKPRWRQLLTEMQMVLHGSRVNQLRMQQGKLAVNSLWFWGGGALPAAEHVAWDYVMSDDVLTAGLATSAGVTLLPADPTTLRAREGNILLVLAAPALLPEQDVALHQQYVAALEQQWFTVLRQLLRQRKLQELHVLLPHGLAYRITPTDLYKAWRRWRSWERVLT